MNPKEIQDLVKTLRDCGVTHYKDGELELRLGVIPVVMPKEETESISQEAQKYASQLLDDKFMMDKLFPAGSDDGGAEEPALSD